MSRRVRNWRLQNFFATPAVVAFFGTLAIVALGAKPSPGRALVIWNATASAPIGLYRATHAQMPSRGDLVLALPTPSLAAFAARRGYLPSGIPLVKRIAAIAGDAVCTRGQAMFVNGRFEAERLAADSQGRSLPTWSGCRTLRAGEVLLLMPEVPTSFDGRYFGPTPASQIVSILDPLWTR